MVCPRLWSVAVTLCALTQALSARALVREQQTAGKISGEYEDYLLAFRRGTKFIGRERAARLKISYDSGPFEVVASYYTAPAFHSQSLNESWFGYKRSAYTVRLGQLMLPIGQSDWDDQWYDPANTFPSVETYPFIKNTSLNSTTPSLMAVGSNGAEQLAVSAFGIASAPSEYKNNLVSDAVDGLAARYQRYFANTIIGVSTAQSLPGRTRDAGLYCVDGRYTIPHLVTRGEFLWNTRPTDRSQGGFITFTYRGDHWSDASLFFRFQMLHQQSGIFDQREVLGAKIRAPYDFTVNINYTMGPHMGAFRSGAGWSVQLYRVYRF